MTEEALDPAPSAGEESSAEARPRPRRRRRGGRGRGRGGGQSRAAESQERPAEPAEGPAERPDQGRGVSSTRSPEVPPKRAAPRPAQEPSGPEDGEGGSRPARRRTRRGSRGRGRGRSAQKAGTAAQEEQGKAPQQEQGKAPQQKEPSDGARRPRASAERPSQRRRGRRPAERQDRAAADTADTAEAPDAAQAREPADSADTGKAPARRRSRRRKSTAVAPASAQAEHLAEPVQHEPAESRPGRATARATAAPTRTSRQARRAAGDRRRRQPIVHVDRRTEKTMLMTEDDGRLQIVVLEERDLVEHYVTKSGAQSMVGNIYLGRVQNVLPGMEAAFVDVGRGRNAVLYAGEVSFDEDVERGDRRIEAVLKPGQSVLVQVTKDPLKGKGARLTAQISLPGRYLVYVPDGGASGISRRLPDAERERLRKIVKRIRPSEAGVIVRTAAEGASEEELAADLDRLKKGWEAIKRKSKRGKGPKLLYEEPELVERVVRDVFSPTEFEQIVTDSGEVFDRVAGYLRDVAPDLLDRVKLHDGKLPLFEAFHVAEQIRKALERKVWLPSGGYLFIDRTEAMTVIDVNTGKAVGKRNLEETVTATNLEAAREIPRQLRLRDIGGIIVIDFIDMMMATNRDKVVQTLREELAHDKTRSQVFEITALGLLEMTRKKVSAGLVEAFSEPCPTCEGRGILLTHES